MYQLYNESTRVVNNTKVNASHCDITIGASCNSNRLGNVSVMKKCD